MGYLRRQLVTGALTANAVRPVPGAAVGIPAMFAGWFVSELSPHFFAVTAADTVRELVRPSGNRDLALLGAANLVGLALVMRQGGLSQQTFESGLVEGLGTGYREELESRHTDLDWKTPLRDLTWPFRQRAQGVEILKNIPYAPEHGRRGQLDVYRPEGDVADAPVLLQVHGGAWTFGSKDMQGLPLMKHMASRGWVCFGINYRLSPRAKFPDHLVDVKRAIAWIREHGKEYGADPSFVAITGGSAGGHLAALAALTPNDREYQPGFEDADTELQAAVPFYGVYDVAGATGSKSAVWMRDRFLAPRVFFEDPRTNIEPFQKASPVLRVRKDAPPFYVIHGVNDTLVSVGQAREFIRALREVSDQAVAYTELSGTQHAFDVFPSVRSQNSVRGVDRFLRWAHDRWRGVATASDEQMEATDPREE
ncbi:MAG TPA: alpha/beta hydrolase [Marmoricola sp.]|nr:alpha/beta hydrolase [Marmoricola sp.]